MKILHLKYIKHYNMVISHTYKYMHTHPVRQKLMYVCTTNKPPFVTDQQLQCGAQKKTHVVSFETFPLSLSQPRSSGWGQ